MQTILKGVVGSTAYGLAHADSDVDRLAVHLSPIEDVLTWGAKPTYVSTDPDVTSHDVGKYLQLALKGNPTVLELLWLPQYEVMTDWGEVLVLHANALLSADAVRNAYGGYAMQQIRRLRNRADNSFSADTRKRKPKHARHCFRLLIQGEVLLRTGRLQIVLAEDQKKTLWNISEMAERDEDEWLEEQFEAYDKRLQEAYEKTVLPEHPDVYRVRDLLLKIRLDQAREAIVG